MSSLGDLLLGKVSDRSSSPSDQTREHHQHRHDDVKNEDSTSHDAESSLDAQKVFPERIEKNEFEDNRSHASSTDDYVRELLDPNDRPRNVWHVVEGPKKLTEAEQGQLDQGNSQSASSYNDESFNLSTNEKTEKIKSHDIAKDDEAYNNISSDERKAEKLNQAIEDYNDYNDNVEGKGSNHGGSEDRRPDGKSHHDRSRERSLSPRHRHRDRRDDRDRDRNRRHGRSRALDKDRGKDHSSDRYRSHRKYDSSDDDDDYDRSRKSKHRNRSSRSRSRSPSRISSRRRERSKSDSQSPITKRNSRTVLIMQLSPRVVSRDLEEFFSELGRVREVRLIMDSKTRRHKGIAYIEFEDAATASKALALNGQKFLGVPMVIQSALLERNRGDWHSSTAHHASNHISSYSSSRSNPPPNSYRVYVGGLHVALTEDMIKSVFEPFGPIIKLELMKDRTTGVSRGYAFLTYANTEDGQEAVRCLDGFELAGKNLRVSKSADKSKH